VVLPAASFAEKDGTFTNAERRLQRVRAGIPTPGEAKTDFAILQALLEALGAEGASGPADAFAKLTAATELYRGIDLDMLGPQGYVWGGDILTPISRNLVAVAGSRPLDARYQLVVGSALYHSGTVSTHARGPMAVVAEPYIEFGREDAAALDIKEGDLVKLTADGGEIQAKAKVDRRLPQGVLFAPYHFAELGLNRIYRGQATIAVQFGQ
jgi:predicted molibdopterin-dependent oxidoreductase YjgC